MRLFKWLGLGLLAPVLSYAAVSVTINGTSYSIPQTNEKGWGTNVTNWIQAISGNTLQPSGGAFTLSAETDFGANFGLKSTYFKSRTANPASAGSFRLANLDLIKWRNSGNSSDLSLGVGSADGILAFGGVDLVNTAATQTLTNKTLSSPSISQIINTGTLTLPTSTDTLIGRATTDTLTNKTIDTSTNTIKSTGALANKVLTADGSGNTLWGSALADPMTTIGDMIIRNGSNATARLGVGSSSQVLGVSGGVPAWVPASVNAGVTAVKTTTYTIASTDDFVLGDATSAAFTETLPSASAYTGKKLIVKKVDSTLNAITIARAGSDTIDGATSTSLNTQNETLTLISDGVSKWYIQSRNYPTTWTTQTVTGSWTSNASYSALGRRVGSEFEMQVLVSLTGAPNAASLTVSMPTGLTIDSSKLLNTSTGISATSVLGVGGYNTASDGYLNAWTVYSSTSAVAANFGNGTGLNSRPIDASTGAWASGSLVYLRFKVPIQGWN